MLSLTPDEVVLWRDLRRIAGQGDTVTYGDLMEGLRERVTVDLGSTFRTPLYGMLAHVSTYEKSRGRPLLSVIVVRAGGSHDPGPGFFNLARQLNFEWEDDRQFFVQQRDAVWALWSANDSVELMDAALTPLLDRIDRLERLLRRR
jgi:hypothetical protein